MECCLNRLLSLVQILTAQSVLMQAAVVAPAVQPTKTQVVPQATTAQPVTTAQPATTSRQAKSQIEPQPTAKPTRTAPPESTNVQSQKSSAASQTKALPPSAPVAPPTVSPASSQPSVPPTVIYEPQEVRALPGGLNKTLMINSNSPEVIKSEGILFSTFPATGMHEEKAHTSAKLNGRFDIFFHHINNKIGQSDTKTLYIGILVNNPTDKAEKVRVEQGASYVSQPDAPFAPMVTQIENPEGTIFSGPGDRVCDDLLREKRQAIFDEAVEIPPGESRILASLPISVKGLVPPLNGRSGLLRVKTDGSVYVALLAMFAQQAGDKTEREPTLGEWQGLLQGGDFAGPREAAASPADTTSTYLYGRASGIQRGTHWRTRIVDSPGDRLSVPDSGKQVSYVLSTVERGTFGTGQVQSAPLVVRNPDTAYAAHGNYCVQYQLMLPLFNDSNLPKRVLVSIQSPLNLNDKTGLSFHKPPQVRPYFRGTVRVRYRDDGNKAQTKYIHLVLNRGEHGPPLARLNMAPQEKRIVSIEFLYPPDSTPPQVLTVKTE
jgi:hypothetical protein